jgi:hypothetical protein
VAQEIRGTDCRQQIGMSSSLFENDVAMHTRLAFTEREVLSMLSF